MDQRLDRSERLVRAYRTLADTTDAAGRATSEAVLLSEVCRIATEDAGYRLAWVGFAEPDGRVRPVAWSGGEEGYLQTVDVRWDDTPSGRGPTGTALRTGQPAIVQNLLTDPAFGPWRAEAVKRGYASSAAFPLSEGSDSFGALNLYAPEPTAFDDEEIRLLQRVARVLSHGIGCSRGRLYLGQMESALQRLDRLETAGHVAATIAHDVNNCLAVVLPSLDQLADSTVAKDAQEAVERAVRLNQKLLRLGRGRGARGHAAPIAIDAQVASLTPMLRRAAAPCELTVDSGADPWRAAVEPEELDQVLTNLVINARDAMSGRGVVRVHTRRVPLLHPLSARHVGVAAAEYVSIEVSDDGIGISPAVRERLFEPFFTTKGAAGTGLGLASVFGIVRERGGHVCVESALGTGTTFEVLLPRAAA